MAMVRDIRFAAPAASGSGSIDKLALSMTVLAALPAILPLDRFGASVGIVALVVPVLLAAWIKARRLLIADPIIVLGFMWILAVSLPMLVPLVRPGVYTDPIWFQLTPWSLDIASLWMYRGWAACCVAYWLTCLMLRPPPEMRQDAPGVLAAEGVPRRLIGWLGLAASLAFIITTRGQAYSHLDASQYASTSTIDQIIHEVRQLSKLYLFLYFFARARGQDTSGDRYLVIGTFAIFVVIFSASSAKIVALELLVMWLLGNAAGAKRGQIVRELALGSVAFVIVYWIFLVVTAYRVELLLLASNPNASFTQAIAIQVEAFGNAVAHVWNGRELGSFEQSYGIGSIFDRLAYVSAFATVIEFSFGESPFQHAFESFLTPLLAVVPRDLVGTKVQFLGSGTFAGMIGWEAGGFSVTLPGSLYWAWGYQGMVVAMAVAGIWLGVGAILGNRTGFGGIIWRTLLVRLVLALVDVGLEFQATAVTMTRTAIFLLVLLAIARHMSAGERPARAFAASRRPARP
jgi:hypothetical protein